MRAEAAAAIETAVVPPAASSFALEEESFQLRLARTRPLSASDTYSPDAVTTHTLLFGYDFAFMMGLRRAFLVVVKLTPLLLAVVVAVALAVAGSTVPRLAIGAEAAAAAPALCVRVDAGIGSCSDSHSDSELALDDDGAAGVGTAMPAASVCPTAATTRFCLARAAAATAPALAAAAFSVMTTGLFLPSGPGKRL